MLINSRIFAIILSVVIILTFAFSGCGSQKNAETTLKMQTTGQETGQSTAPVEQQVSWDKNVQKTIVLSTINGYYTTALQEIAKDYTALHPETKVSVEIIADNDTYKTNFNTKMAADKTTAPDIIHVNLVVNSDADIGPYMEKGWIAPLSDLLDEPNPYNAGLSVKDAFEDQTQLKKAIYSTGKVAFLPFDLVGVGFFYNKDAFEKAGAKEPATYEDLIEACTKLQTAGYKNPLGASAFADWIRQDLYDWAFKKYVPEIISLPGDARYDEKTMSANVSLKYDPNDPNFDAFAVTDDEKLTLFKKNFNRNNDAAKKIWSTFNSVAQFFQTGWSDSDENQTYTDFVGGKVPIFLSGSWNVGKILGDMKKLPDDKKFKWGTFKFPKFAQADPNFEGDPRGLLVAGHRLGLTQKDDKDLMMRSADFLKYLYSPSIAAKVYDVTVQNGELVQGPSLIKGVQLSDEVNSYLDGFKVAGSMNFALVNMEEQQLPADQAVFKDLKVKFSLGRVTWDQFYTENEKIIMKFIDDTIKTNKYDLDPKTLDK